MQRRAVTPRATKRAFSTLGGHAALDLLNTRPIGTEGPVERLASFDDVLAWCAQFGVIEPADARRLRNAQGGAAALGEVRALREHLRAAVAAPSAKHHSWRTLTAALNTALARRPIVYRLERGRDGFTLKSMHEATAVRHVPALIGKCIAAFLAGPDLAHVRACAAEECVLWFVDRTRNHSRRWCSMDGCGDRAKARAYYQRRRARG